MLSKSVQNTSPPRKPPDYPSLNEQRKIVRQRDADKFRSIPFTLGYGSDGSEDKLNK